MSMLRSLALALLLGLATGAAAQQAQQTQQAPGLPGGDPAVQSTAPEVGAGRGDVNAQPPPTSEQTTPTGGPRPAEPQATAPRPPTPTTEIPPAPPLNSRGGPPASELELEHALRGGVIGGRVTIPNQSAGILVQPQGRDWRQFRTQVLTWTGLVVVLGVILALAVFYLLRGKTRIESGRSGRTVQRYTALERVNHWMVASSFILLALTGLNITYGAYVLRPVIGPELFTELTWWGQAIHHYLAFAFILGILVMLALWLRHNLISRVDIAWLRAGGPLAKGHPPAGKFNAGQKLLFWFTMLGGLALAVSGAPMMLPGLLDDVNANQWAHIVHGTLAMVMIAAILGHIYIGSVGMEGALEGMLNGEVDYNWAREHHSQWLEEELERARRSVTPEPAVPPRGRVAGAD